MRISRHLRIPAATLLTTAVASSLALTAAAPASAAPKPRAATPTLSSDQSAVTRSATVSFTFASTTAGAKYTCVLDGASSTCTSPKSYAGLAEGTHTFSVTASARNYRPSLAATRSWTVDRTNPAAVVFAGVPTTPVKASPSITFTGESGATFTCQIDTAPAQTCTQSATGTNAVTGEGRHSVTVIDTDAAGNVGPAATAVWFVDTTPPAVSVSNPPAAVNNASTVSVSFSVTGADAATQAVQCQLKRGGTTVSPLADCTAGATPGTYSFSGPTSNDGSYTLTIVATDLAGNVSSTPLTWSRQATAPGAPVLSGPSTFTSDAAPSITWPDVSGATGYSCAVDSTDVSAFADCSTGFPPSGVSAEGFHTVYVKSHDSLNNFSAASTWSWTRDATAPSVTINGGPSDPSNASSATFAVGATDANNVASVVCTLSFNGAQVSQAACPSDGTFDTSAEGSYVLGVVATDVAGNSNPATTRAWVVDHTAPTAAASGLGSLVGPLTLTFNEPVRELVQGAVALTMTDGGASVPAAMSCRSAAGAGVACTSTFTTVRVSPAQHLVPGQHYTLAVADGAVSDVAGNVSAAQPTVFRASQQAEENSTAVVSAWAKVAASAAYGHSFVREHLAGAQVSYRFTGRSVTWSTVTGPSYGKALVLVDGHRKGQVNNYATSTHYKVARTFKRLAAGTHVISVRVLGLKGAKLGKGTDVAVDAFAVGTRRVVTPALTSAWKRVANSKLYAGHAALADRKGATFSITFRGTAVTWYTATNRTQGKVKVYLDGVLKSTVDNFSSAARFHVARALTGLTDKVHTLRLVVLGTHRSGGKGTQVTVDRCAIG